MVDQSDKLKTFTKFTAIWKIENFSIRANRFKEPMSDLQFSPPFTVGILEGSTWLLRHANTCYYVECGLARCSDDRYTGEITICFYFEFIVGNGNIVVRTDEVYKSFGRKESYFRNKLVSKVRVLKELEESGSDTLTIKCHMIPANCVTELQIKTIIGYNWSHEMWDVEFPDSARWTKSRSFTFKDNYPILITLSARNDYIFIQIQKTDSDIKKEIPVTLVISLWNNNRVETLSQISSHFLNVDVWTFPSFISKSYLKNHNCLKNGIFTLKIEFSVSDSEENSTVNVMTTLQKELRAMFLNQLHSDVKLKVDQELIPSHKCILAARSPVFDTMFNQDMLESRTGIVDLSDMDADILKHFLVFMYTGTVNKLDYENAIKLLVVADQYQVLSLKKICSSYLIAVLCIKNACEVLLNADLVNDEDLKSAALDYTVKNSAQILSSPEWLPWLRQNGELATEVLAKISLQSVSQKN